MRKIERNSNMYQKIFFVLCGCGFILSLTSCIKIDTGNYPPLIEASIEGNIAEAEKLLKQGSLINQTTLGNRRAVHFAAVNGHDEMITWLFTHGADITAQDAGGYTPINLAKEYGHSSTEVLLNTYTQLLQEEADALKSGDMEKLKSLIETKDPRGYTLLLVMIELRFPLSEINKEIASGSNVNAQDEMGFSPLHRAIGGNGQVIEALVDAGANVNVVDVYNSTPLYYAVGNGYENDVTLLLEAGADMTIRSTLDNLNALEVAQKIGNQKIIDLMRQYDAP